MRRTAFIILAAAGGLVALLLIAVAIVVWRVDPNNYVGLIQAQIKHATGRDVTIRGGIDLKVSLTPKIVVHDLSLANAPWGRAPQMMTAKQFELEVALLPLLRQHFEVIRVGLVEPSIAFETDAQGHANWDFAGTAAAGTAPAQSGAASQAAFGVGNITITNGTLTYRDGKSGAMTTVAIDTLALSARNAQSPVSAEFRGKVDDVAVALTGQLGPLDSLVQRRWPYPFALTGEIDGQKTEIGAKVRVEGEAVHVDELAVLLGPNVVKGTVSVVSGGARPRYTINLTAPVLTVAPAAALGAPAKLTASGAAAPGGTRSHSTYLFSDAPLPLTALRTIDASGEVQIGRLLISPPREFTAVQMRFTLRDGHLDVPLLKAATFGGSVDAHATLDVPASGPPALALAVDARNLDLGAELAVLDVRRDVKGGKTSVKADLRAHGASLHDLAASASGNFTAIAGPATIANTQLNLDNAFDRVAKVANPFRDKDPTTELKCAVIRLPLASGVAHIDRSVAAETQKLGVSVSGTLDLRSESIDVTFKPQLREGIPIDVSQIAELVRLRGPLRNPQVTVDAMASVTTIARIGAGFSTGGLSEVGVALFGAVGRGGPGPCAVALGAPAAKTTTDAKTPATVQGNESVSRALGKLLGR